MSSLSEESSEAPPSNELDRAVVACDSKLLKGLRRRGIGWF